ncbi:LysR family transcriptional regulator [Halomonas sp. FME1]|uniref:LysR family transcriptional regulator n=2 Tax=Halomonas TaxID=2745 RepID=A0ABR9EYQ8_9GAMM|nr:MULTISPECIES: LysR family transcriptional regulator [Halomonas]MBE0398811.1 LysR family transcriptional regulator [Halomonas casei]PCC21278.1 LysR family transcriptional regulator [Halomonas sp. JB37]
MIPSLESITARLRLRHFRLLIAIDEHGSLIKAAESVSISQPGATKALQEIEEAVGSALFLRTNRGLSPNEVGHCIIRYARLIYQDLAHLREEIESILDGHGGRLAVGTIMGAVPLLTDHLTQLLKRQPAMRIELVEDTSAHLLDLLDSGRLEIAICRTSVSPRPEAYITTRIWEEQLAIVANSSHPLTGLNAQLSDLAASTWIVYAADMPMRRYLEQEFQTHGLPFPNELVETTSAFATLSLLQRNPTFVALLSTEVAQVLSRTGMTSNLLVDLPARSEPYYLVHKRDRSLSPAARLLSEQFTALLPPLDRKT